MARSRSRLTAALLAGLLVLAACGGDGDGGGGGDDDGGTAAGDGGLSGDPIVVGFLAPMTGASALTAEQQVNAATLAVEEVNEAGGVDGRPLELEVYDTELEPELAAQQAQRAITQDGVVALVGGYSTSEALAAREVVERAEVPLITASASTPAVTEDSTFVFRVAPLSPDLVTGVVRVAAALGVQSPAVLNDSGGSGLFFGPLLEETATELGLPPAGDRIEFPINASDVSAQVSAAAAQDPDGILIGGSTGADHGLVAKAMIDQGLDVPFLGFSPIVLPDAVEISSGAYEQLPAVYTVQTADTTKPAYQELLEAYNERHDAVENLPEQAIQAYDAVQVLAQALAETGGEGGEALATALEELPPYDGAAGRTGAMIDFTADRHDGLSGDYLNAYRMEGGQPVQDTELEF